MEVNLEMIKGIIEYCEEIRQSFPMPVEAAYEKPYRMLYIALIELQLNQKKMEEEKKEL